jgi:hypothetical protein
VPEGDACLPERIAASAGPRALPEVGGLSVRPEGRGVPPLRRRRPPARASAPPAPPRAAPPDPEGRGRNLNLSL